MKYKVEITIQGYIVIEADSIEEARAHAEDGFSLSQFVVDDNDIDEIYEIKEGTNV